MKKPLKVPDYFKDLPDDANLNSRDMMKIFGYKTITAFNNAKYIGKIPASDVRMQCGSIRTVNIQKGTVGTHHVFWKVKTIKEWIENDNRNIPK